MGTTTAILLIGIGSFFHTLWEWLGKLWDSIKGIPGAIIDLLGQLLQWLFVPSDDFFSSNIEEIKQQISQKIPYDDYVSLFETIKTVESGESFSIDLPEYQVSSDLKIKQDKFIDFGNITKYRDKWYGWVRGFTFIFLIIYNINQITKFLRGINVADGATLVGQNNEGSKKS